MKNTPAFPCSAEQFTNGNQAVGDAWSGMTVQYADALIAELEK